MSRLGKIVFVCLLAGLSLVFANYVLADNALRLDEARTTLKLRTGQAQIALAVDNPAGRELPAQIKLELLDTDGTVRAQATQSVALKRGLNAVPFALPFIWGDLRYSNQRNFFWFRLRYEITPQERENAPQALAGLVSVSQLDTELFTLQGFAPQGTRTGQDYTVRLRANHPRTEKPVKGVSLSGVLRLDTNEDEDKRPTVKAASATDEEGYATLVFTLPRGTEVGQANLEILAQLGDFTQEADEYINFDRRQPYAIVNTDKPLYQPGQTLHARALAFDPAQRAWAGQTLKLKVQDPESQTIFRAEAVTSRFGVANFAWPIPDNSRLGSYSVEVASENDTLGGESFRLSRYDLPTFAVKTKPDKPYYLPGQNAEVAVTGAYLFGQPVTRGRVRVVREEERTWNYREQKYDLKESAEIKGETDEKGVFTARIDLSSYHEDIKDESDGAFRDVTFAAYFTDLTTNRTEQRRFDVRVTRHPIHVYFITPSYQLPKKLPLEFYLSASYADGAPCVACSISISETDSSGDPEDDKPKGPIRVVKTNALGVAKVNELRLSAASLDESSPDLTFAARDSEGRAGRKTDDFYWNDAEDALRLSAERTLYRNGDSFKVKARASIATGSLFFDVMSQGRVIHTGRAQLNEGRAEIAVPYRPEFRNEVVVNAFTLNDAGDQLRDVYTVFYPYDDELKLELKPDRETHQPGQEAEVNFTVRAPGGGPVESALGIVAFDRAVEERARTDSEFGRGGSFGFYWWGENGSFSGVTRRDLKLLDATKKVPEGFDLAAEVLLNRSRETRWDELSGDGYNEVSRAYATALEAVAKPIRERLQQLYDAKQEYPRDLDALRRMLAPAINPDALRDPWGQPFRYVFGLSAQNDTFAVISAGPDQKFATGDELTLVNLARPYFRPYHEAIERAAQRFHGRTGCYIRETETLTAELRRDNVDLDKLKDRWGEPYQLTFGISQQFYTISVTSKGPDRVLGFVNNKNDDFSLALVMTDYFSESRAQIQTAFTQYLRDAGRYPANESEFRAAMREAKFDFDNLRDAWGRPFYVNVSEYSRYADQQTKQDLPNGQQRTVITPVTQKYVRFAVRSTGPNNENYSGDDFTIATYEGLISTQSSRQAHAKALKPTFVITNGTGAISGAITDPNGAAVANATVTATNEANQETRATNSNDEGRYSLVGLTPGAYTVSVEANGFAKTVIPNVGVISGNVTENNVMLNVAGASSTVDVTVAAEATTNMALMTTSSVTVNGQRQGNNFQLKGKDSAKLSSAASASQPLLATPRLREYFPETLVWQPELVTDAQGRARLKFKFADNITTWKMSVVGSTVDGQMGLAEAELPAFQPFFAEHDPPKVLTEGDEISLPVVLRNYLPKKQEVSVTMKPENWFTLLGAAEQRAGVPAGDATRVIFPFRAVASVTEGKQRVTAIGGEASDAIERSVTVHPDGEERSATTGQILGDAATLEVNLPPDALKNSLAGELKIYPNLLAHVGESVTGLLKRPYGCAEQTISSTYPNLLILRFDKQAGTNSPNHELAARYLKLGYERLLNYRGADGGFSYWGRGEYDFALTAYALRFLTDAREFTQVDESFIKATRDWLIANQRADGSWPAYDYWPQKKENSARTLLQTSYLARVLAESAGKTNPQSPIPNPQLKYVFDRLDTIDEPHFIANYALAARAAGDTEGMNLALGKLREQAKEEAGITYWNLETNTPFYGWGTAGRVETTALAVQALARGGLAQDAPLINRSLLFLLKNKDHYGVWYSTQATINVLDALISQGVSTGNTNAPVTVLVNGKTAGEIVLPDVKGIPNPVTFNVSPWLQTGRNLIVLQRAAGAARASVNLVANYYVPWGAGQATRQENFLAGASRALRLAVNYDKTQSAVNQDVTCTVEAERVGFQGYGMLLAEIGLPPGADVDRASLDKAVSRTGWDLSQYDVLPDKLIVYLWPRAGGTKFAFKFRLRYGLNAQTAPSVLYDYYNPESRAVVAPTRFVVQ